MKNRTRLTGLRFFLKTYAMLQLRLLVVSLLVCSGLFAQEKKGKTDFNVSLDTYLSSGNDLPFWLTSNKNGVFSMQNSNYQLLQAGFSKKLLPDSVNKWSYTWGANLVYGYGGKSDFQANQYWLGLRQFYTKGCRRQMGISTGRTMHGHFRESHYQRTIIYPFFSGRIGFPSELSLRRNCFQTMHS
jgi:hypothetical protein